jgi:hypothetical protein
LDILYRLLKHCLSLIDQMLRGPDSGLILRKLIAKQLALQEDMLGIAFGRGFERRLAGDKGA